jgi:hypothetical protein
MCNILSTTRREVGDHAAPIRYGHSGEIIPMIKMIIKPIMIMDVAENILIL